MLLLILYMLVPVFLLEFYRCFFARSKYIIPLYILMFCQYWSHWYDVVYYLIIFDKVYISSVFAFSTPDPVLLLFQFQFLLSDLPSTAIRKFLLHQQAVYLYFWYNGHPLLCFNLDCLRTIQIFNCMFNFSPFWGTLLIFGLSSSTNFGNILIVEFIIVWLLPWLLTIFTNWPSLYFAFRYSAILNISVLFCMPF